MKNLGTTISRRVWSAGLVLALLGTGTLGAQTSRTSIKADKLAGEPYLVDGSGVSIGVFEAEGRASKLHPQLVGTKIEVKTFDAIIDDHASGVIGIIGANGANNLTRGIARGATLYTYSPRLNEDNVREKDLEGFFKNFFETLGEGNSIPWTISNHSYGGDGLAGWKPVDSAGTLIWRWHGEPGTQAAYGNTTQDPKFGWYGPLAEELDRFCAINIRQIPVFSAGNYNEKFPWDGVTTYHRRTATSWQVVSTPRAQWPQMAGGAGHYDCMEGFKTAKNGITVGSVYRSGNTWKRSAFSSAGPTDDGRVKPDVVAFGDRGIVLDRQDTTFSQGTSFSAPAVSGVLAQLAQLWKKLGNQSTMLSSTARVLLCHTADDLGTSGPDYHYGWGMVNAQQAGELLLKRTSTSGFALQERTLKLNKRDTIYIKAKAKAKIKVTMAWIDPPGTVVPAAGNGVPPLNNRTKALVNDLDMKVYPISGPNDNTPGVGVLPWQLNYADPAAAAQRKDNNIDNIEQVTTTAPSTLNSNVKGVYMIVIEHSGPLYSPIGTPTDQELYTIAISGADEYFPAPTQITPQQLAQNGTRVKWRPMPNATGYDVEYRPAGDGGWQTKATGMAGTQVDFTNLSPGTLLVRVRARRGTTMLGTWSNPVACIIGQPPTPTGLNASFITTSTALLRWNAVAGATSYQVAWAPVTVDGGTLLADFKYKTLPETQWNATGLPADEYVLWYVQALAAPNGESEWAEGDMFATSLNCTSYEPQNDGYAQARVARPGEAFSGLICKNDVSDFHRIDSTGHRKDRYFYLQFGAHSKPYNVRLWRQQIPNGAYSIVANTSTTLSPTEGGAIVHNSLDFNFYRYWVEVVSPNPSVIYSEGEPYVFSFESRNNAPYSAAQNPDDAPGLSRRGGEEPNNGGSLVEGASLHQAVNSMAAGE